MNNRRKIKAPYYAHTQTARLVSANKEVEFTFN